MTNQPLINPDNYQILATKEFKLKDRPENRRFQLINLRLNFGTIPDIIAISKIPGQNNKFVVQAFVPKKFDTSVSPSAKENVKKIVVRARDPESFVIRKAEPKKK